MLLYGGDVICQWCDETAPHNRRSCRMRALNRQMNADSEHQRQAGIAAGRLQAARRGTGKGYVKENGRHQHRVVIEHALGRPLKSTELVHHRDGNAQNNDLNNLEVVTRKEHNERHGTYERTPEHRRRMSAAVSQARRR